MADGGVVFLDEIGELAPALQVKLLRVLQEREFERLGGSRPISIDIRLIAATNKDLAEAVKARTFREDLYYRLNVVSLVLPRLRERLEDIPILAEYFVAKFAAKCKVRAKKISPEAMAGLVNYTWPGNVRELENAIERALVLGVSDSIRPEDLPESVVEKDAGPGVQEPADLARSGPTAAGLAPLLRGSQIRSGGGARYRPTIRAGENPRAWPVRLSCDVP